MGGVWRLVFFLLLCACLTLPPTHAASFADCFPSAPLERFWQDSAYVAANPNIISMWYIHAYSFSFDNSTASLGLEDASLANGSALLAGAPEQRRASLSAAAALLSQANGELEKAKAARLSSHGLVQKAQVAVRENFGMESALLSNVFFLAPAVHLNTLLKTLDISNFVALYPAQYSSALEHAAAAHDGAQAAARELAALAETERDFLSLAGAGSPDYSGAALQPFNYAESLLAPETGICHGEEAAYWKMAGYFAGKPQLPDFADAGYALRMESLAGTGANASIFRMLSLFLFLSDAKDAMISEYSSGVLSAQESARELSAEITLLGDERLELIGDAAPSGGGSMLLVGSGNAGICSGYLQAKEDFARAEAHLASAKASYASKAAEGWLANAIASAHSSDGLSQSALVSLKLVRAGAESAVEAQARAAEKAIAEARQATGVQASSLASAQSLSSARAALEAAGEKFGAAPMMGPLGLRYAAYTDAARLAGNAIALSQSPQDAAAVQGAERALSGYSSLVGAAGRDGLDVSYERELLSQYRALVSSSQSPDVAAAVQEAALQAQQELLLRLYWQFSYLEESYAEAARQAQAAGECEPQLLQQQAKLSQYFPEGRLDASRAAGSMASIGSGIGSLAASASSKAVACLSALLSGNAHLSEAYSTPVLGQATGYSASITTQNPSLLASPGEVSFSIRTSVPLYSADFDGGDAMADAYPGDGKTVIALPMAAPGQAFSFHFSKLDAPAQMTSSEDSCLIATEEYARAGREISFVSSRALPALLVSQAAPPLSYDAVARYNGQEFPLSQIGGALCGQAGPVPQGKGEMSVSYSVRTPFFISLSERAYETLAMGAKRASFTVFLSAPALSCGSGSVSFMEPCSGISNLSVAALSGEKIIRASAADAGGGTLATFSFSPLVEGKEASFAVSYVISDPQAALSEALAQAELLVLTYNRTKDALALSEARGLASLGRTNEALAVLSQMGDDARKLSYSAGDRLLYLQERALADASVTPLLSAQAQLSGANSTCAAQFSSAVFKYQTALQSASYDADSGNYQKAVTALRKAQGDLSSSLAALALSSLKAASDGYAAARRAPGTGIALSSAEMELSGAQGAYTGGDFTQAILHASSAVSLAAEAAGTTAADGERQLASAESLRTAYAALRAEAELMLANYTPQYAALSTQSKRQLPFTPAQAQSRLDEADKLLAASRKASLAPPEALAQANSSYAKLSSLHGSLSDALASLSSSAASSLSVARAALAEVEARAGAEDAKLVGGEVARAGEFLANAMYADSLASSDRAIAAANTALSKASGANPLQPVALALISLAFLGGAAYYFFFAEKKRAPPEEKKEVPKAE